MPRIVMLTHEIDRFQTGPYMLREIANIWSQRGIQILVQRGLGPKLDVDLAVNHIDLTVMPEAYRKHVQGYPRVLNGRVTDISKRHISRRLVTRGDGYDGPVIVKTNCNFGGLQELRAEQRDVDPATAKRRLHYRLCSSPGKVPEFIWNDPVWVVERFVSEMEDGLYCLRTWVFLGDRETNSLCHSPDPIVKSRNIVRRQPVAEVPDELRQMRADLGFDYGKFDYAIVQGRVVLYDANRTPSVGGFDAQKMAPTIQLLAQGIDAFLPS